MHHASATTAGPPASASRPRRTPSWFSRSLFIALVVGWLWLAWLVRATAGLEVLLFGAVAIGGLVIVGAGRNGLLSPVFHYDLVRTARRGHLQSHRFLFAVFLAAALYLTYSSHVGGFDLSFSLSINVPRNVPRNQVGEPIPGPNRLAQFTWGFVSKVLLLQYVAVLLVTPAYVATALPQEKQQRTLEFILTTDLSDGEIVLGLLASRLANLGLLIITGLPILGFLQFLGGVDPQLVLCGVVTVLLSMLSLGSVSVLVSVFAARPGPALLHAYFWVAILSFGSLCIPVVQFANPAFAVEWFASAQGPDFAVMLTANLAIAFLWHGGVTYFVCRWAIREFRAASSRQLPLPTSPPLVPALLQRPVMVRTAAGWEVLTMERPGPQCVAAREPLPSGSRPVDGWGPFPPSPDKDGTDLGWRPPHDWDSRPRRRVGEDALLWKETLSLITVEQIIAFARGWPIVAAVAVVGVLFTAHLWIDSQQLDAGPLNGIFRGLNAAAFSLVLLAAAINAAGRVSREREQQTLETLRTLPITTFQILLAKWLGSIWSLVPICGLLMGVWLLAALVTALHAAALPLLFAASAILLTFMASLGLWFSTIQRTTLRSTLFTVLVALLLLTSAGSVFVGRPASSYRGTEASWIERLYDHTVSPAQMLWTLSFCSSALLGKEDPNGVPEIVAAVVALHFYILVTVLLWLSMIRRLEADKGSSRRRHDLVETKLHLPVEHPP